MSNWLVDESGEIWPAHSEILRSRLGFAQRVPEERAAYLVTNMGYIAIEMRARGLSVRWRPTWVRRETLAAALLHLAEQPSQRVMIESLTTDWTTRLLPTVEAARDALLTEFGTTKATDGSYFVARPRSAAILGPTSHLRRIFDTAVLNAFRYNPHDLWHHLETHAVGRYLLLDPEPERRGFRIMALGRGFVAPNHEWRRRAPGSPFEEQPDAVYAQEAAKSYWAALEKRSPVVEEVEASTWWQSRGRIAARYTRLVLPLEIAGRCRVLSTTELH